MTEIWAVRHGETEWSRTGQHTGRTDLSLTETGRAQARKLGDLLSAQTFTQVLSSPLRRAHETATLAGYAGATAVPDLMEWDYGDLEGRTTADIRGELPQWSIWNGPVPGGETLEQVAERARRVLSLCAEGRTLLFAHGHILRVLAACWVELPPQHGQRLSLSTATISVLSLEHQTRVIQRWNMSP